MNTAVEMVGASGAGKAPPEVWVITDGKAGDELPCLAIAQGLGRQVEKRVAAPRAPWSWAAPWGPSDPREAPGRFGGPLAGAPPAIAIVSGRRAIPLGLALKRRHGDGVTLIILKDPRFGRSLADLIWAPSHDRLMGANICSTLTSPHALSAQIAAALNDPAPMIARLPKPFLGIVLGGPTKARIGERGGADYGDAQAAALGARVSLAGRDYAAIAVCPSRRTPPAFLRALRASLKHDQVFVWDSADPQTGKNPYTDILGLADSLIVAADSHNMVSESLAGASAVYVWRPHGLAEKLRWFTNQVIARGDARLFEERAPVFERRPVDATAEIIATIRTRLGV